MPTTIQTAYDLSGQVALVTGGARGIGLSIATLLVEQGARVVLIDANPQVAEIAAGLCPGGIGLMLDVRDAAAIAAAVAQIIGETGRIDILVNNVGVGVIAPALETTDEIWDLNMGVNLRAAFIFSREVGRHMIARGYGRIVSMASQAALAALDDHVAYGASKAARMGSEGRHQQHHLAHRHQHADGPDDLGRRAWRPLPRQNPRRPVRGGRGGRPCGALSGEQGGRHD